MQVQKIKVLRTHTQWLAHLLLRVDKNLSDEVKAKLKEQSCKQNKKSGK